MIRGGFHASFGKSHAQAPLVLAVVPLVRLVLSLLSSLWLRPSPSPSLPRQDPTLEFLRKFTIGLVSGTISSCVNIPFDVAKSRIQGPQPVAGQIKYRTCFQTMAVVYREEG